MAIEKRFQVFVSSTYTDLIEERKEVMQALLELDCIPSGMELFQAADEDQWSLIKRVIDDCDYYLVIVGGRCGSVSADGVSFTDMEYRYALETSKPVLAFLHERPDEITAGKTETSTEGKANLEKFRSLCQQKVVKYYSSPEGLGSAVSRSVIKLIKDRPAIGWVRGDTISSDEADREILKLRKRIDELEASVSVNSDEPPEGSESLLQLNDEFDVNAVVTLQQEAHSYRTEKLRYPTETKLNEVLKYVGPHLMDELTEKRLEILVDDFFLGNFLTKFRTLEKYKKRVVKAIEAEDTTFQEIKIQLIALGIIQKGDRRRPPSDANVYWKLTPFGEKSLMGLLARHKAA